MWRDINQRFWLEFDHKNYIYWTSMLLVLLDMFEFKIKIFLTLQFAVQPCKFCKKKLPFLFPHSIEIGKFGSYIERSWQVNKTREAPLKKRSKVLYICWPSYFRPAPTRAQLYEETFQPFLIKKKYSLK